MKGGMYIHGTSNGSRFPLNRHIVLHIAYVIICILNIVELRQIYRIAKTVYTGIKNLFLYTILQSFELMLLEFSLKWIRKNINKKRSQNIRYSHQFKTDCCLLSA